MGRQRRDCEKRKEPEEYYVLETKEEEFMERESLRPKAPRS